MQKWHITTHTTHTDRGGGGGVVCCWLLGCFDAAVNRSEKNEVKKKGLLLYEYTAKDVRMALIKNKIKPKIFHNIPSV
jgi:hypothetical protein